MKTSVCRSAVAVAFVALTGTSCVSQDTHTKTLTEFEQSKKASAQRIAALEAEKQRTADELEAAKKQAAADAAAFDAEKSRLTSELAAARAKLGDLDQQLAHIQREAASAKQSFDEASARAAALEKEREQLTVELSDAKSRVKELDGKLAAAEASLQEQKRTLTAVSAAGQSESAKLKERLAGLEREAARLRALEQELADRERQLTESRRSATAAAEELAKLREALSAAERERTQLADEITQREERLKAEAAEKARLEEERAAKEAEIQRLTKTREDLSKSLEEEIAKGNIRIKQVRDRLTIDMVDRVLFDSGQVQVKPAGLNVLKQVSDVLKQVGDKQIRVEGHTDNVPISTKLRDKFATNWELSTARATTVVRFLIEQGGVDRDILSAVGYADTRPQMTNDSEEGRAANRRIEIILYPKDLSEIASRLN